MLIIGLLFAAVIGAFILLDSGNSEKIMEDYCRNECKRNILNKNKFCC